MLIVCWDEPLEGGGNVQQRIPLAEAIGRAKAAAQLKGHTYLSDEQAAEDFLSIHWAWIEHQEPIVAPTMRPGRVVTVDSPLFRLGSGR